MTPEEPMADDAVLTATDGDVQAWRDFTMALAEGKVNRDILAREAFAWGWNAALSEADAARQPNDASGLRAALEKLVRFIDDRNPDDHPETTCHPGNCPVAKARAALAASPDDRSGSQDGPDWPAIAKALFKEIPTCTGCDFDHGWDDHVRAVARDTIAATTPGQPPEAP